LPDAHSKRGVNWGLVLVGLGAMLFACKGLFAKALYARGVDSNTLVTVRALIALPLFWSFALLHEGRAALAAPSRTALLAAAAAGVICYYFGALVDFHALTLIDASIERVLLFGYPAFVVAATAFMERRRPTNAVMAAVALTWVGIFFSVGGFDLDELRANATGGLFAILAGISYGIYFLIGARFTRELGSARFTLYAMTASAAALAMHFLVTGDFAAITQYDLDTWLLLITIGTVCMFVPVLLQAEGLRRVGAVRGAVVATVGPPTTVILAYWLLDERLTGWQVAGMLLILAGILVLDLARLKTPVLPAE
jgi:drug/metabolite transporter (DMT)-like permease